MSVQFVDAVPTGCCQLVIPAVVDAICVGFCFRKIWANSIGRNPLGTSFVSRCKGFSESEIGCANTQNHTLSLSVRFNGRGVQDVSIVEFTGAKDDGGGEPVTTGAIRRAQLQSNRLRQQTNTQFFTGRMSFLSPNQQCQSTEGKLETTLRDGFERHEKRRRL